VLIFKKIIFFGTVPLAAKCLEHLYSMLDVEILGVITSHKEKSKWREMEDGKEVSYIIDKYDLREIGMEDINNLSPDLGFTIRFSKIIPPEIINQFKEGIINLHGGPIPYYKGLNSVNFAILNDEEKFGVSLHFIDEKIDEGEHICTRWFDVFPDDTAYTLFKRTMKNSWLLFEEISEKIIEDRYEEIRTDIPGKMNLKGEEKYYSSKDLEKYREVTLDMSLNEIYRRARAFEFPGHERAYIKHNDNKIYLKVEKNE